jgi:hypothetical protein
MNTEKKIYTIIIGSCVLSVLLGVGFGYLIFGGASVNATLYTGNTTQASVPAISSGTLSEIIASQPDNDDAPPSHRYLVTVVDGYITVFYADHTGGGLKETTTSPAYILPSADLERLQEGIRVYTEEALARVLQDYGS